ncbi:Ca2+/Na+ antiporter [Arthrobacter sp. CAN_A214]
MSVVAIQWVALAACLLGAAIRIPDVVRGRGRVVFAALVLLSVAVGLSLEPIYLAVDQLLGGVNLANLMIRLCLYAVFVLLGVRMVAAFKAPRARKFVVGPLGIAVLAVTVGATVYFFVQSDLPYSDTGLTAFADQEAVERYSEAGRLYPGYVAACLVGPALASAVNRHTRSLHRLAGAFLALGFGMVTVFAALQLFNVDLGAGAIVLPFSAILCVVLGLCLIWFSKRRAARSGGRSNLLAQ